MVGIYVLAALVIKPKPAVPLQNEAEEEFYNSYVSSRHMALHRLQRTFDRLDQRIQRLEGIVTTRDYDWERRLRE
jgi:phage shock protein C